jgi:uncharacterized protein YaiL (DUF2058 family)
MGNALQDQLLKSGLVNDRQLKKARKEKGKEARSGQAPAGDTPADTGQPNHAVMQREKAERDRALNQQRQEAQQQKAAVAQVRQLIEAHREHCEPGDRPYNFVAEGKVRRLYVSEATSRKIAAGRLAIVTVDGKYELVSAETAEKIRARHLPSLVLWNEPGDTRQDADLGEYSGYEIPDDLVW